MGKLTEKNAKRWFDNAGLCISELEKDADDCASYLMKLKSQPESDILAVYKSVLQTSLMLDYINLDIWAAFRQYLSVELNTSYDKRQAMTKINVIISEGYKKIYGFNSTKDSFWKVQINQAVNYINDLRDEYDAIECQLKSLKSNSENDTNDAFNKDMRDLSVHYDKDPLKVYDMLASLNAEEISKRCISFLTVLTHIRQFVGKIIYLIKEKLTNKY